MKKCTLIVNFVLILLLSTNSLAQVAINTDGSSPNGSAILDLKSSSMGLLLPRLSTTDRDAISLPTDGLVIFNTTTNSLNYYTAGFWNEISGAPDVSTVYNSTTGETWMDRNLGATQVATSSTDAAAYGDLYQWGRAKEGHEVRTSGYTNITATTSVPNGGNTWDGFFIQGSDYPNDWLTPQDNTLWQGVSGTNNPCPSGFRLPTSIEWEAERQSWATNNAAGAFGSVLKLVSGGSRHYSTANLQGVGASGYYWSSSPSGYHSLYLIFTSSSYIAQVTYALRAAGMSIRCIKE